MKIHVRWYPNLAVVVPEEEDPSVVEAYEMLAANIARGLITTRGDEMAIVMQRGENWLGARVHCKPALAKRERQEVLRLVGGLSFLFPWVSQGGPQKEAAKGEDSPLNQSLLANLLGPEAQQDADVQVFDPALVDAGTALQQLSVDSDSKHKLQAVLKKLLSHGTTRPRSRPASDWCQRLAELECEFLGFSAVIQQVVRPHLSLLVAGAKRVRMPPVLLVGPPGVGKSLFARRLAQILGTTTLAVDMASATNNATLAGSSNFWANSQPGLLFSTLAWGAPGFPPVADPLVILDEVDKTSSDRYDPLGPLYTLLEQGTAKTFEDQALPGIVMDASQVRWVLTANDTSSIPAPILSRVLVFEIQRPDGQELMHIAQRMLASTIQELGIPFEPMIPEEASKLVSGMGARELKVRLESAIGTAIGSGRLCLVAEDFIGVWQVREKARLGFV